VLCANGHDVEQIDGAVEKAEAHKGQPTIIILDTIKGKGFSFAEGNPAYHNGIFTEELYAQAVRELDAVEAGL
jgi:transketolase